MFGNDKKNLASPVPGGVTLVSEQTTLRGDLRFTGGQVRIDGKVIGSVVAESGTGARIEVCTKGVVEGEIHGPLIVVDGQVQGNIVSTERISLLSGARINGNLFYKVLEMAAGAQVSGQIRRVEEGQVIDARTEPMPVATVAAPLKIEESKDSTLSVRVEPGKESNVEAVVVKEGRNKRNS